MTAFPVHDEAHDAFMMLPAYSGTERALYVWHTSFSLKISLYSSIPVTFSLVFTRSLQR